MWAPFARSFQERQEGLTHEFPCIQIQADVTLGLGQREQPSRDGRRLCSLACVVQSDHRQHHPFERFLDICWLVKVLSEALQRLDRLGVLPLCQKDTRQQQHLPFVQLHKWEVLLLARVFLAQRQYAQAVETLERFREHLDQPADIEKTLEWMVLSVVALHHAGKRAQATSVAARLLALTEPEGYIRLYLDAGKLMQQALLALLEAAGKGGPHASREDGNSVSAHPISRSYVSRLLEVFEQEEQTRAHRAGTPLASWQEIQPMHPAAEVQRQGAEPLSRQELKVLRLLVTGQTYAEMAEALIVSPNTIKTQVSSIYRKLGVSRRAAAIAVTARLHLL